MTTGSVICQNIKNDSITLSLKTFDNMVKADRKCDSVRSAMFKKDELINDLINSNLKSFQEFMEEREEKKKAIEAREEAAKKLKNFDAKRFSLSLTVGPVVTQEFKFAAGIMFGISYNIFRF